MKKNNASVGGGFAKSNWLVLLLFGSSANDASFNAWVTDNTKPEYRGSVESIISILPLAAMLVVAGGFGDRKSVV